MTAKPAKTTRPICVSEFCPLINSSAAAFADSNRFGKMSVEHMLRETSMARMMVAFDAGSVTTETGLAIAMMRLDMAIRNKANGRCRFHCDCLGAAARISDRLE